MRYVICGANSRTGRLIARDLAARAPVADIVLVTTSPEDLSDWAEHGAQVRYGGYNDIASLKKAFADGDVLMLNNCIEIRSSAEQHRNVVETAKGAGVSHVVYSSSVGAHPNNPRPSVATHVATERLLWECGLGFTVLRSQLYSEFGFHWGADQLMRSGKCYVLGSGDYHYAPVSRRDTAACAAAVMCAPQAHDRVVYEVTGDERVSIQDLARIAGEVLDMPVVCESVSEAQMRVIFESGGVPRSGGGSAMTIPFLLGWEELVKTYVALESGYCDVQSSHVQMILGRSPIGLREVFLSKAGKGAGA